MSVLAFGGRRSAEATVAVVTVCALAVTTAVATGATTPRSRVQAIRAAGDAQHSVHYATSNSGPAPRGGWETFVGDAGTTIGRQLITFRKNGRVGHVTVIATPTHAYIRGDAFTLENYMDFPVGVAEKYANTWIVMDKSWSGYPSVSADVMLRSAVSEIGVGRPTAVLPATTRDGKRVIGVRGVLKVPRTGSVTSTVYAPASGPPLATSEVDRFGGDVQTTTYRWNTPVRVTVPKRAVPVQQLSAGGTTLA